MSEIDELTPEQVIAAYEVTSELLDGEVVKWTFTDELVRKGSLIALGLPGEEHIRPLIESCSKALAYPVGIVVKLSDRYLKAPVPGGIRFRLVGYVEHKDGPLFSAGLNLNIPAPKFHSQIKNITS